MKHILIVIKISTIIILSLIGINIYVNKKHSNYNEKENYKKIYVSLENDNEIQWKKVLNKIKRGEDFTYTFQNKIITIEFKTDKSNFILEESSKFSILSLTENTNSW